MLNTALRWRVVPSGFLACLASVGKRPGIEGNPATRNAKHASTAPRRICARALLEIFLTLSNRGRREHRVRAAPAVSCATNAQKHAHEHTGQRRQSGIPCAMVLTLIS